MDKKENITNNKINSSDIAFGLFKAFFMVAFWPITLLILFLGILFPHE